MTLGGKRSEQVPKLETDITKANLVGSRIEVSLKSAKTPQYRHKPVLDLDVSCMLLPSSTKGHHHLYIDKALTTEQYDKLLKVMVEVGLYNEGCYKTWKQHGSTFVRLPWVEKKEEDTKGYITGVPEIDI